METEWYRMSAAEALEVLGSDSERGLSTAEASGRLRESGPNELVERAGRSPFRILLDQLTGVMTLVLFAAALISVVLTDYLEAVAILAIVVLNAVLGFTQEYRAEQSMAALKRMATPTVRVRRDSATLEISAREVAPGDIVLLESGNLVPADGRVVRSVNLRAQEAALTGESEAVDKQADLIFESERVVGDRRNMLYMGTAIGYGHGRMVVTATGMATELGRIADMIQSVESEATPLQRRLDRLGKILAVAALVLTAVIFVLGVLRGEKIEEMLLTAVSLAVAAIPEALTAVVTIALALGAQRMLRRSALIRKLPAVETLGSVNVICSDKTGTLTQNRMTVTALDITDHRLEMEPGAEKGALVPSAQELERMGDGVLPTLDLLLVGGALCNDAVLVDGGIEEGEAQFRTIGDPTEGALVLAAAGFGIRKDDLDDALPRVAELPFDSVRKRMTTIHRVPRTLDEVPPSLERVWRRRPTLAPAPAFVSFTKGALDSLLTVSHSVWVEGEILELDDDMRTRIVASHDGLARKGMRVLAVGLRMFAEVPPHEELETAERELVLVGLVGMMDPPRPEVTEAVRTCRTAGIRPVMITGDHPLTARHIAQQVGISDTEAFISGGELETLSAEDLVAATSRVSVFARVSPAHKLRLVEAYQQQGQVVAMTGDGVNDAPALKKADIGVAMGITGTDVSKEAAKMVLLDDNFATIVAAVEEGRIIYDNIRKFVKYLLSCNTSEIAVMLIGPFFGLPLPLLPLQILWMNLVTDGLPALALGVEPAERDVMRRPPYPSGSGIFARRMVPFIIAIGVVMSLVALSVGVASYRTGDQQWRTLLFTTLILCQLAVALEVRAETASLFSRGFLSNRLMVWAVFLTVVLQGLVIYVPLLQRVFQTSPLSATDVAIAVAAALFMLVAVEAWKGVLRYLDRHPVASG